jgi:hypothetical protein
LCLTPALVDYRVRRPPDALIMQTIMQADSGHALGVQGDI